MVTHVLCVLIFAKVGFDFSALPEEEVRLDALPDLCAKPSGDAAPGDETLGFGFAAVLDWHFAGENFWDGTVFFTARLARGATASSRNSINS